MDESSVYITKQGKINFVDLAGSEMTKKTNSSGKTLEEANNINKSLMILGEEDTRSFSIISYYDAIANNLVFLFRILHIVA